MSQQNLESFISGLVQDRSTIRFVSQIDELKDAGSTASRLNKMLLVDGKVFTTKLEWHANRMCIHSVPESHLVSTGPAGIVSILTKAGKEEEEIDSTLDGPERRGDICDMRVIGDHVYVCGMSRQVYRREGKNMWTRQDEGLVKPRGSFDLVGFNAIDGLTEKDILAVGFGGEIWRRQKQTWRQLESPTNVVLTALRVVKPNLAFACGQQGILLRGRGDHWEVIAAEGTKEDLWGVEWFNDKLYVASTNNLYTWDEKSNDLEKVTLDMKGKYTFSHLHQNDGLLLSVGPKHVIYTEDGTKWVDTKA